jgi:hypothetical protein
METGLFSNAWTIYAQPKRKIISHTRILGAGSLHRAPTMVKFGYADHRTHTGASSAAHFC